MKTHHLNFGADAGVAYFTFTVLYNIRIYTNWITNINEKKYIKLRKNGLEKFWFRTYDIES